MSNSRCEECASFSQKGGIPFCRENGKKIENVTYDECHRAFKPKGGEGGKKDV